MNPFPCPHCGRSLEQTGTVTSEGRTRPVYQCDDCIVRADFGGEPFELNLTFCLDERGRPFDPATPDGSLPPLVTRPPSREGDASPST